MGSTTEGVRAQSTTYNVQISYKRNSPESHGEKRRNHNESLTAPPLSWSRISISGPRLPGTILNWHNGESIGTRNKSTRLGVRMRARVHRIVPPGPSTLKMDGALSKLKTR